MKRVLLAFGFVAAALPALAQTSNQPRVGIGVSVGDYLPSSTAIKDAFGSNIFTIGITPVSFGRPSANAVTPSFTIIGADQHGSSFLLIPVTLGYEMHFGNQTGSTVPYARLEAGFCYFNYSVDTPSGTINGSRIGETAAAEVGVEFLKDMRLSARYNLFTQESGLSFNGLELSLTIGIIRL